jgi:hypothetical protein
MSPFQGSCLGRFGIYQGLTPLAIECRPIRGSKPKAKSVTTFGVKTAVLGTPFATLIISDNAEAAYQSSASENYDAACLIDPD